jgi:asparagine synthase (glutamine-hydrolysing)
MCGIIGMFDPEGRAPVDRVLLARANDAMTHRGPDEAGIHTEPGLGLAMRRLSILDIAHGHQPMTNEDASLVLVYNGEIYNHQALAAELGSCGHTFRTAGDTEVILHGYEQWGLAGCLARLCGMFAFALWDRRTRALFLVRDRLGMKPLYIAERHGRVVFASEIRPLLLLSGMERAVNGAVLREYLEAGFVTAPRTLFRGIRKLPAAHVLELSRTGQILTRYWDIPEAEPDRRPAGEIIHGFRVLLEDAVASHMVSDVPVGALLSGGIDSSVVAAYMQKHSVHPVRTLSVGFEARAYDETARAAVTARFLGTDHATIRLTNRAMEEYPAALLRREEPAIDTLILAADGLFRACRDRGLTVVLTGEGADELLGGYPWHRMDLLVRPLLKLPRALRRQAARLLSLRYHGDAPLRVCRVLERDDPDTVERYLDLMGPGVSGRVAALTAPAAGADREDGGAVEVWRKLLGGRRRSGELDRLLYLEAGTRLMERMTHNLDRMSMAHSVEARPPFLDHRFWEYCAGVPASLRIRVSVRGVEEKHLLREAVRGLIPEEVRVRKKRGLAVPYAGWLAQERLPEWAETALSEEEVRRSGVFDPAEVLRLRADHRRGVPGLAPLLLGVVSIQLWWRMFIAAPPWCRSTDRPDP